MCDEKCVKLLTGEDNFTANWSENVRGYSTALANSIYILEREERAQSRMHGRMPK
jgi:hypothetical protein